MRRPNEPLDVDIAAVFLRAALARSPTHLQRREPRDSESSATRSRRVFGATYDFHVSSSCTGWVRDLLARVLSLAKLICPEKRAHTWPQTRVLTFGFMLQNVTAGTGGEGGGERGSTNRGEGTCSARTAGEGGRRAIGMPSVHSTLMTVLAVCAFHSQAIGKRV